MYFITCASLFDLFCKIFFTFYLVRVQKTKEEKEENNAIVHQLGLPQTEIFDLFQSTRNIILKYLRHHPLQKNKILESVVRVVTLTGKKLDSYHQYQLLL